MKNSTKIFICGTLLIVLVAGVYFLVRTKSAPGPLDAFAKCLRDKGALFYGAFWCPHCQNQKAMFGASVQYLPYIECSTSDGQGQLQVCKDQKIEGYPTWIFADGSRESGEVPLARLAEKTNCLLPRSQPNIRQ